MYEYNRAYNVEQRRFLNYYRTNNHSLNKNKDYLISVGFDLKEFKCNLHSELGRDHSNPFKSITGINKLLGKFNQNRVWLAFELCHILKSKVASKAHVRIVFLGKMMYAL